VEYLTVSETAAELQLSVPTVKRYIYEGKLESSKLPGGQHRIARSEVDRLLAPGDETQHGADEGAQTDEERLSLLERWVSELQDEMERMAAALEVMSRFCAHMSEYVPPAPEETEQHQVLILGPGCRRCNALRDLTQRVLTNMGCADQPVVHVRDLDDIAAYGPIVTPALVVDNQVLTSGRLPTQTALRDILQRHLD